MAVEKDVWAVLPDLLPHCTLHFGHYMIFSPGHMILFVQKMSGGQTATSSSLDNHDV